jgi:UDP-N-acetylglucosamine 3-dehydrogenase
MKVGVVGVGSMGQNHARIYSEMADLVGVFDLDSKAGEGIARRFGTSYFSDLGDLLKEVDAISIATPTSVHHKVATQAIEAGVGMLVEKPFTGDPDRGEELCRRAEKEGLTLAVGLVERFNPAVSAAKEAMDESSFGDLISISSRRVSSFPSRIRDVGVIMDLGIHDIDVIRHVTSREVKAVYAMGGMYANERFEDHAAIFLELEGGKVGFIETNWLTPMKVRKVFMTCSESFVELDFIDQSLETSSSKLGEIDTANMFQLPLEFDRHKMSLRKEEPLKRELSDFLAAVKGGRDANVTGWDALADLDVCLAACRCLKERRRVEIPPRR